MSTATLPEISSWATGVSESDAFADEGMSFRRRAGNRDPQYLTHLAEAMAVYQGALHGNRTQVRHFIESMSTSDFPNLFGDILQRQLLGRYADMPAANWSAFLRRGTVPDFRTVKRFAVDGAEAFLADVDQEAPYQAAALTETPYSYSVTKRGRRIPISWETMINDDLGAFRDLDQRLARAARRSEERFATDLYAGTTGPDATFFAAGHNNIITANPVLGISGLQTGYTVLSNQRDADNEPIYVEAAVLVVPPALQIVAETILNATYIFAAAGGGDGTGNDQLQVNNWMRNKLTLVVDPYLPVISTTNGATSWYMFASPNGGRPAGEFGFLQGHESPELFRKMPDAVRLGGGSDPEAGSFENDTMDIKVRHVFGGTMLDYKMAVASNGTGV